MPEQTWKDMRIGVETRPPFAIRGMNEIIVIASRGKRQPVNDLIVSLQIRNTGKWNQAIQDGHTGAYRRAIAVRDPKTDVLEVKIQHGEEEKLLEFPLHQQTIPVHASD